MTRDQALDLVAKLERNGFDAHIAPGRFGIYEVKVTGDRWPEDRPQ